jgi:hypothetical protein
VSNSQYTRSQFAGLTTSSSVRGRVVAACIRVCNVSAANTRNGVFTLFQDPQHNTLQSKPSGLVATDQKARQFNASTPDWHTVTYHPVEPDEVDSWVWDPARGPQGGVKTGAYIAPSVFDASAADSFPGYMGIWWNGDSVSQTFQVEMYVIAEYVGALVQPLVRESDATVDMLQDAQHAAENTSVHVASATDGANHSGHPSSDTHPSKIDQLSTFVKTHKEGLKSAAKVGIVGLAGVTGGPAVARAAAKILYTEEQIAKAQRVAGRVAEAYEAGRGGRASTASTAPYYRNPALEGSGSRYTSPYASAARSRTPARATSRRAR